VRGHTALVQEHLLALGFLNGVKPRCSMTNSSPQINATSCFDFKSGQQDTYWTFWRSNCLLASPSCPISG